MFMIPWKLLDKAEIAGDRSEMLLYQRGEEFSIRVKGCELMNSRVHGSEDLLAHHACARIKERTAPQLLIGGLGMGFTAAAALQMLHPQSRVIVAELVPAVVEWNRRFLGHLADHPLDDQRLTVREEDVAQVLRKDQNAYDAILLDVDNGPKGLSHKGNDWLYGNAGLKAAHAALRPTGILAVWSASQDIAFATRLATNGFNVEELAVRAREGSKGNRHTIWLATRT
jgi:spermidine synthase